MNSARGRDSDQEEKSALMLQKLNRFKLFIIFYEIHDVVSNLFETYSNLYLECKVLTYTLKVRLKQASYD